MMHVFAVACFTNDAEGNSNRSYASYEKTRQQARSQNNAPAIARHTVMWLMTVQQSSSHFVAQALTHDSSTFFITLSGAKYSSGMQRMQRHASNFI